MSQSSWSFYFSPSNNDNNNNNNNNSPSSTPQSQNKLSPIIHGEPVTELAKAAKHRKMSLNKLTSAAPKSSQKQSSLSSANTPLGQVESSFPASVSTSIEINIPTFVATKNFAKPTNDMYRFELRRAFSKSFHFKDKDMTKFKEMTIEQVMKELFEAPYPHPKLPLTRLIVEIHVAAIEWGNELLRQPQDKAKIQAQKNKLKDLGSQIGPHNVEYIADGLRHWMINHGFVGIAQAIPDLF